MNNIKSYKVFFYWFFMKTEEKILINGYGVRMYSYGVMYGVQKVLKGELEGEFWRIEREERDFAIMESEDYLRKHKRESEDKLADLKRYSLNASKSEGFYKIVKEDLDEMKRFYENSISYINSRLENLD